MIMREGNGEIRRQNVHNKKAESEEAMAVAPALEARGLRLGTKMGTWITVLSPKANGTELGDQ